MRSVNPPGRVERYQVRYIYNIRPDKSFRVAAKPSILRDFIWPFRSDWTRFYFTRSVSHECNTLFLFWTITQQYIYILNIKSLFVFPFFLSRVGRKTIVSIRHGDNIFRPISRIVPYLIPKRLNKTFWYFLTSLYKLDKFWVLLIIQFEAHTELFSYILD